ncbi:PREDICTED: nucleoside diphosphate kinase 6-like [Dinoponera quadriceps]|uniref:Nucleoside diphosphate kinase 6-like n=1 Tax=Dinoponera quadriceps TaxID=609295 RepID=A0A6P3WW56_DINQU|nr:PREDICTED: nucleoside diphosphate kinase 6-like [Dinoponera quadriceps]
MQSRKYLQLTLAILKPHIVKCPFALQKIRDLIIDNDFKVVRSRRMTISREEAELFYKEHRDRFFYNRLLSFICSGPSDIHILAAHDAIVKWRRLMGPTKVYQAQYIAQNTIRGMFGLSDTRNATHGSDSTESASREITVFFKDFNIRNWYDNEELFYYLGRLYFDQTSFVHTIDKSYTKI